MLISRLRRAWVKYNPYIDQRISPSLSSWQRFWILVDIKLEKKLYGASTANYFEYDYYWKNRRGRDEFANHKRTKKIYDICNPIEKRYITGSKKEFNTLFSRFLNRKWLLVSDSTFEEFSRFFSEFDAVFAKPVNGECGNGSQIIDTKQNKDLRALYEDLRAKDMILEELISQHEAFEQLNPTSVNTMRIVTLRDIHENIHVMAGVLRIGRKGQIVDNFHHGGMCALIDLSSGIVMSTAVDAAHDRFVLHPDTNVPIVGFRVPYWDRVIDTVQTAARHMTDLRYIGWDVVVGKQGIIYIVEANSTPDTDLTQAPDQIGKWNQYCKLVDEIKMSTLK